MTIAASPQKRSPSRKTKRADLLPQRELRGIIETVLQLAKSTDAEETEVHVDEVADALTRFANNGIHQNVAELTLNVSVQIKEHNSRKRGPFGTSSLSFHPTLIGQRSLPFQNSPERRSSM